MIDDIRSLPWALTFIAFFFVAFFRAGGTYVIGRLIAAGAISRRPASPRLEAAAQRVADWGAPAVALCFLTVGAQTLVNLAAGLMRMPVPQYLAGLVPGAAIWSSIWSTIGMGAFYAVLRAGGAGAWEWGAVLLAVAATAGFVAWRLRRRRR